jgi:hypothetical protein
LLLEILQFVLLNRHQHGGRGSQDESKQLREKAASRGFHRTNQNCTRNEQNYIQHRLKLCAPKFLGNLREGTSGEESYSGSVP